MFWSPVGAAEPPGFGRTQDRPGTATRQNLPDLPDLPDQLQPAPSCDLVTESFFLT